MRRVLSNMGRRMLMGRNGATTLRIPICVRDAARRPMTTGQSILGQPFETKPWPFNSACVDTDEIHVPDSSDFTTRMVLTIHKLKQEKRSAVWVKVHVLNSHFISILSTYGFRYHHALDEYAVLYLWLGPPQENKIPPFATHLVGVAGFVLNKDKEVLMVKEQSKIFAGWKLPGGYLNLGEEFGDAACREVFEETGVKCAFKSLLALRHQHSSMFGRSDIYVITRLEALTNELNIDKDEITDAAWFPLERFRAEAAHPILKVVAELTKAIELEAPSSELTGADIVETEHPSVVPGRPNFKLYSTRTGQTS